MLVSWPLQKRCLPLILMVIISIPMFSLFIFMNTNYLHYMPRLININLPDIQYRISNNTTDIRNITFNPEGVKITETSADEYVIPTNSSEEDELEKLILVQDIYEPGFNNTPNICPNLGQDVKLVIVITSAPINSSARLNIRKTWGHFRMRRDIEIAFIVGKSSNETFSETIQTEQNLYGDLIIGNFVDAYDNLTLKTLAIHEWVKDYCRQADFVLKTDDDMFINVPTLLKYIDTLTPKTEAIYGWLAKRWKPIRSKRSKYYLSKMIYSDPYLPEFNTGPAYLFPSHISEKLYNGALPLHYFKLEDVFFNGILSSKLGILHINNSQFLNRWMRLDSCTIHKYISVHLVTEAKLYEFWKTQHLKVNCKKRGYKMPPFKKKTFKKNLVDKTHL